MNFMFDNCTFDRLGIHQISLAFPIAPQKMINTINNINNGQEQEV